MIAARAVATRAEVLTRTVIMNPAHLIMSP
jgi:hypothetical protein